MRYLVNGSQMKSADQYTISQMGIPSLTLMERAAEKCIEVMEEKGLDLSSPCIVCGSGNNGGDGFAIARILTQKGYHVTTCFVGNEAHCTAETTEQIRRLKETGAKITCGYKEADYSILVDAIFGVGLSREITGNYRHIIEQMNRSGGVKFAVDMPSGIHSGEGTVLGIAFRADYTVTFQLEKIGLKLYPGKEYAGCVIPADIGIHTDLIELDTQVAYTYDKEEYCSILPARKADSHKGTYGKLLVIAGSKGMSGAAYLNAKAAYRTGAGLVQIYTPEENRVILQTLLPEAIISTYTSYDEEQLLRLLAWADTVCIGSGIGTGKNSWKILKTTITHGKVPCLIDADGLNLLAKHKKYLSQLFSDQVVLTPHMKEMERLTDKSVSELKQKRMELLNEFVQQYPVVCALKDSRTVVASHQKAPYVNLSGNSAMAKAGSGDVLTGIIAGLMAQKVPCYEAAVLGVYLHGASGDRARDRKGSYSVMAEDLIENLSSVLIEQEEMAHEKI
ncbi:MAG: NAD(P)H-hydrate dehydratase [Dorea sp.]